MLGVCSCCSHCSCLCRKGRTCFIPTLRESPEATLKYCSSSLPWLCRSVGFTCLCTVRCHHCHRSVQLYLHRTFHNDGTEIETEIFLNCIVVSGASWNFSAHCGRSEVQNTLAPSASRRVLELAGECYTVNCAAAVQNPCLVQERLS